MSSLRTQESARPKRRRNLILFVVGIALLVVIVGGIASLNSPSRAKSQLSSTVSVSTPGLHGQQVVAQGSLQNSSFIFYSGDRIAVNVSLVYWIFPGDPDSVKIVSINDSDGFGVASVTPALPATLTGNPKGIVLTVILVAPKSSYTGDMHINVNFYVPPPPA